MTRPHKHRRCRTEVAGRFFKPQGIPIQNLQTTHIALEEFEAMRLCDLEKKEQSEAGLQMQVSRGTVQRLLESGRAKLIQALLENQAIFITETPSCCAKVVCVGAPVSEPF